ncbi:MAG: tannase/feruloyl esterase family alpha/beta hydrolase, partial [Rhodospirillaceae bacterium]|nr:tannase/feruloyl esterase family alpha/beta hydrolase [Rhodospirillaceae bacterium]
DQIPPGISVDYYETSSRTMGGPDQTTDFFRMFMIPSMLHCIMGGPGGTEVDWITAIENWVEKDEAPEQIVVHRMKSTGYSVPRPRHPLDPNDYDQKRPVYPYPAVARFKGEGDPNDPDAWQKTGE